MNSVSSYYGFNPGSYVMTVVKNISVTDNFLSLPNNQKNCMDDVYEECKTKSLLRKGLQFYNCTSFGLSQAVKQKLVSYLVGFQGPLV